MNTARFLLTIFLIFLMGILKAQEDTPRIGLVLSGGGAKGLAHIGVLKVLEEEGIRPDFITGTSMGSIIGGLYAIGYNASELDSIVNHANWTRLLSDNIPLSYVSPYEKNEYNRYQAEFTLTRDGLQIPSGLIQGQEINDLLTGLSWHVRDIEDFDRYPIPFRCVAADLKSGREYVFKKGDLPTALRASMSIPSVFSPVRKDSLLLVDGGVLNNFPVELCKDMGADIIIGVNVGFPDKTDQNQTESFTEILMAAATISGNISTQTAIKQTDVLISPDLSRYNTASFFESKKIIQLGEEAARKELEKLRNLKDSTRIQTRSPIQICKTPNKVRVAEIQVKGLQNINKQFLLGNLGIEPGDYISPNQMTQALRKAMGTRHFENITYQVKSQSETAVLVLHVEESPRAKAKFSLHYDNEYKAGLITNFTARNVLGKSSRTSFNIDISETPKASLSQINFIGKNKATASRLEVIRENNNFPVYLDNGSKYGTFEHHYTSLRGGIMTTIGTNWQMDAYVRYSLSSLRNESGFSDIFYAGVDHFGNAFSTSSLDFTYNSTDNHYFPHKGTDLQLSCNFNLNATELYSGTREGRSMISDFINIPYKNYFIASGNYNRYIPLNTHLTTGIRLAGQWTNRSIPLMDYTFIGGLPFNNRSKEVHFIGYSFREKIAEDFALGEINFRYKILEQVHINAMGSLLLSRINLPETIEPVGLDKSQRTIGYGLLVAFDSFLGPVQVGVGSNNTDPRARWYFNFGFNF